MTTELTKAAQQEHTPEHIAGVDHAHELLRRMGYHRDGDWFIHVNRRGAEAIHISTISTIVNAAQLALTTSQPAQAGEVDERAAFEAWLGREAFTKRSDSGKYESVHVDAMWSAWQARASLPTQPAAQATPVQDVGASADYWGDLAQQKADADARRGVSMPVSYYTSSIVGALLATQQATPDVPETDFGNMATQQATPEPVRLAESVHEDNARILKGILDELRMILGLKYGDSIVAAVRALTATPEPVGEPDTVPLDALHAAERERDYWKTRARAMLDHAEGTCWYWMGDGEDHLESLVSSLPVVIRADQLRELLARPAPGVPDGEVVKPKVEIDLGEGDPRTARIVWSDWDSKANKLVLCLSVRDPDGFTLVPIKSDDAILRPFYNCPPEELGLAWDAAMRVAQVRLAAAQANGGEHV